MKLATKRQSRVARLVDMPRDTIARRSPVVSGPRHSTPSPTAGNSSSTPQYSGTIRDLRSNSLSGKTSPKPSNLMESPEVQAVLRSRFDNYLVDGVMTMDAFSRNVRDLHLTRIGIEKTSKCFADSTLGSKLKSSMSYGQFCDALVAVSIMEYPSNSWTAAINKLIVDRIMPAAGIPHYSATLGPQTPIAASSERPCRSSSLEKGRVSSLLGKSASVESARCGRDGRLKLSPSRHSPRSASQSNSQGSPSLSRDAERSEAALTLNGSPSPPHTSTLRKRCDSLEQKNAEMAVQVENMTSQLEVFKKEKADAMQLVHEMSLRLEQSAASKGPSSPKGMASPTLSSTAPFAIDRKSSSCSELNGGVTLLEELARMSSRGSATANSSLERGGILMAPPMSLRPTVTESGMQTAPEISQADEKGGDETDVSDLKKRLFKCEDMLLEEREVCQKLQVKNRHLKEEHDHITESSESKAMRILRLEAELREEKRAGRKLYIAGNNGGIDEETHNPSDDEFDGAMHASLHDALLVVSTKLSDEKARVDSMMHSLEKLSLTAEEIGGGGVGVSKVKSYGKDVRSHASTLNRTIESLVQYVQEQVDMISSFSNLRRSIKEEEKFSPRQSLGGSVDHACVKCNVIAKEKDKLRQTNDSLETQLEKKHMEFLGEVQKVENAEGKIREQGEKLRLKSVELASARDKMDLYKRRASETHNEEIELQVATLQAEANGLKEMHASYDERIDKIKKEYADLVGECEALRERLEEMEDEKKSAEEHADRVSGLLGEARKQISKLEESVSELTSQNEEQNTMLLRRQKTMIEEFDQDAQRLLTANKKLQEDLRVVQEQLQEALKKKEEKDMEVESLLSEIETISNDHDMLKERNEALTDSIAKATDALAESTEEADRLRSDRDRTVSGHVSQLEDVRSTIQFIRDENASLREELNKTTSIVEKSQETADRSKKLLEEVKADAAADEEKLRLNIKSLEEKLDLAEKNYEEKLSNLETELVSCNKKLEMAQNEVNGAEVRCVSDMKQLEKRAREKIEDARSRHNEELSALKEEHSVALAKLSQANVHLETSLAEANRDMLEAREQLKAEVSSAKERGEKLGQELESARQTLGTKDEVQRVELDRLNSRLSLMKSELEAEQESRKAAEDKANDATSQLSDFQKKYGVMRKEKDQLHQRVKDLQVGKDEDSEKIAQLERGSKAAISDKEKALTGSAERDRVQKDRIRVLERDLNQAHEAATVLTEERDHLQSSLAAEERRSRFLEDSLESMRAELEAHGSADAEKIRISKTLSEKLDRERDRTEAALMEKDEMTKRHVAEMTDLRSWMDEAHRDRDSFKEECEQMQKELASLRSANAAMEGELESLRGRYSDVEAKLRGAEISLREKSSNSSAQAHKIQVLEDTVSTLRQDAEARKTTLREVESERSALRNEADELNAKIISLEEGVASRQTLIEAFKKKVKSQKDASESPKDSNKQLQSALEEIRRLERALHTADERCEALEERVSSSLQENEEIRERLEKAEKEARQSVSKLERLTASANSEKHRLEQAKKAEASAKEECQELQKELSVSRSETEKNHVQLDGLIRETEHLASTVSLKDEEIRRVAESAESKVNEANRRAVRAEERVSLESASVAELKNEIEHKEKRIEALQGELDEIVKSSKKLRQENLETLCMLRSSQTATPTADLRMAELESQLKMKEMDLETENQQREILEKEKEEYLQRFEETTQQLRNAIRECKDAKNSRDAAVNSEERVKKELALHQANLATTEERFSKCKAEAQAQALQYIEEIRVREDKIRDIQQTHESSSAEWKASLEARIEENRTLTELLQNAKEEVENVRQEAFAEVSKMKKSHEEFVDRVNTIHEQLAMKDEQLAIMRETITREVNAETLKEEPRSLGDSIAQELNDAAKQIVDLKAALRKSQMRADNLNGEVKTLKQRIEKAYEHTGLSPTTSRTATDSGDEEGHNEVEDSFKRVVQLEEELRLTKLHHEKEIEQLQRHMKEFTNSEEKDSSTFVPVSPRNPRSMEKMEVDLLKQRLQVKEKEALHLAGVVEGLKTEQEMTEEKTAKLQQEFESLTSQFEGLLAARDGEIRQLQTKLKDSQSTVLTTVDAPMSQASNATKSSQGEIDQDTVDRLLTARDAAVKDREKLEMQVLSLTKQVSEMEERERDVQRSTLKRVTQELQRATDSERDAEILANEYATVIEALQSDLGEMKLTMADQVNEYEMRIAEYEEMFEEEVETNKKNILGLQEQISELEDENQELEKAMAQASLGNTDLISRLEEENTSLKEELADAKDSLEDLKSSLDGVERELAKMKEKEANGVFKEGEAEDEHVGAGMYFEGVEIARLPSLRRAKMALCSAVEKLMDKPMEVRLRSVSTIDREFADSTEEARDAALRSELTKAKSEAERMTRAMQRLQDEMNDMKASLMHADEERDSLLADLEVARRNPNAKVMRRKSSIRISQFTPKIFVNVVDVNSTYMRDKTIETVYCRLQMFGCSAQTSIIRVMPGLATVVFSQSFTFDVATADDESAGLVLELWGSMPEQKPEMIGSLVVTLQQVDKTNNSTELIMPVTTNQGENGPKVRLNLRYMSEAVQRSQAGKEGEEEGKGFLAMSGPKCVNRAVQTMKKKEDAAMQQQMEEVVYENARLQALLESLQDDYASLQVSLEGLPES